MIYDFNDIEASIQIIRKYVRVKRPIPSELLEIISRMCQDDLRNGLYFHVRVLRFPSLKRALKTTPDEETATDDDLQSPDKILPRPERVLIPPPPDIIPEAMYR